MSENEKKSLEVKGLGEKTVPEVEGLKKDAVDVTAMPSVEEAKEAEKIDVTATPTVSAPAEPETFDPTAMPTAAPSAPADNANLKKYLMIGGGVFGFLVVLIIIISLVGGKKVVCTRESEYEGAKLKNVRTFKFDGDGNLKSGKMEITADYSNAKEFKQSDFDAAYESAKKECEEAKDKSKCKVKKSGKKITQTVVYSDEEIKTIKEEEKDFNYQTFKDGKQSSSYGTCKVK